MLACRDDLVCTRRGYLEVNQCELVWWEISSASGSRFVFGVFYRQPDSNSDYLDLINESFNLISNLNVDKVFLVGDFNFPNFDWVNQVPLLFDQLHIKIFELLNDLFLTQMNQHATRNNSILDPVLTSTPDLVNDVSASEGFVDTDHWSVTFTIHLNLNRVTPRPKFALDFKKANLRELKNTLQYIRWNFSVLDNDINTNLSNWEDLFWSAVNEFIPKKKIKDSLTPPWIDKEVKTLCRRNTERVGWP